MAENSQTRGRSEKGKTLLKISSDALPLLRPRSPTPSVSSSRRSKSSRATSAASSLSAASSKAEAACAERCECCDLPCCLEEDHTGTCFCDLHRPAGKLRVPTTVEVDTVLPATRRTYDRALGLFSDWALLLQDNDLDSLALIPTSFDKLLVDYIKYLETTHKTVTLASTTLSAVQDKWPNLRRSLNGGWRRARAWSLSVPHQSRIAWPAELVLATAGLAFTLDRPDAGWAILTATHCLLRPGEICGCDITDFSLKAIQSWVLNIKVGIFTIVAPKTRRRAAPVQHVLIENPGLLNGLRTYFDSLAPDCKKPFPDYREFLRLIRLWHTRLLGPEKALQFGPGGVRGAGATLHYLVERNVPELQRRGRWRSESSLDHYIQVAAAMQAKLHWSDSELAIMERFGTRLAPLLWTHSQCK